MLELRDIHVHYGTSHIVQGLSLSAAAGQVIGIFGRNGVGKTTLLKTIAGWLQPTSGSILLHGTPIHELSTHRIARLGVGFVPEDRRIFPDLSVEENLALGFLQVPGRKAAQNRAALADVYARFPRLAERRSQPGMTLSGGEQQMLAMARVMIGDARLLLIDEPSEGLAPMIVADLYAIIRAMKAEGRTILLVEQNVANALEVSDRFVAIERGQIIYAGSAASEGDRSQLLDAIAV
ncbi:MAG: ABC transporter ATP-binding protein [Hyphomicrobiaceae bacterium]|nr:MAG: ABC transporter ATP-binding protein [Hyphomicrobiaceae bacterium]